MKQPDHSTATTTGGTRDPLPTIEQAMKADAEAEALAGADLANLVYTCALAAINELALRKGDPRWAEAAASLVRALYELGHAGRPVAADEPVAVEDVEPGPTPEPSLEERHPRPWRVETDGDRVPRVSDRNGRPVAVGLEEEKLAYVAVYNREPLLLEIAEAAQEAVQAWRGNLCPNATYAHERLENLLHRLRLADGGGQ